MTTGSPCSSATCRRPMYHRSIPSPSLVGSAEASRSIRPKNSVEVGVSARDAARRCSVAARNSLETRSPPWASRESVCSRIRASSARARARWSRSRWSSGDTDMTTDAFLGQVQGEPCSLTRGRRLSVAVMPGATGGRCRRSPAPVDRLLVGVRPHREGDRDLLLLAAADDGQRDLLADGALADLCDEGLGAGDGGAVDRDDRVAGLQAGVRRRGAGDDLADLGGRPLGRAVGDRGVARADPQVGVLGLAGLDQLLGDGLDLVDRDREADADVAALAAREDPETEAIEELIPTSWPA